MTVMHTQARSPCSQCLGAACLNAKVDTVDRVDSVDSEDLVDGLSAMLNVQAGDCQQEVVKSFAGGRALNVCGVLKDDTEVIPPRWALRRGEYGASRSQSFAAAPSGEDAMEMASAGSGKWGPLRGRSRFRVQRSKGAGV